MTGELIDLDNAIYYAKDWVRVAADLADELVGWDHKENPDGSFGRVSGSGWPEMAYLAEQLEKIHQMFQDLVPPGIKESIRAEYEELERLEGLEDARSL